MPIVQNCGRAEAETLQPNGVCVSISDNAKPFADLRPGWDAVLQLHFEDVTGDDGSSESQVQQIAEFLLANRGKNILAHCEAGISRSGAVVAAVLRAFPEYTDGRPNTYRPNVRTLPMLLKALGVEG